MCIYIQYKIFYWSMLWILEVPKIWCLSMP